MSSHRHGKSEHHHAQPPRAQPSLPPQPSEPTANPPPAPAPPAEDLQAVQAQRDNLLERLQRLSAEYLNYQKRAAREISDAREFAGVGLVKDLLPVLDDLERAIDASAALAEQAPPGNADGPSPAGALLEGTRLVHQKLFDMLSRHGLTRIECVGKPFDPLRHHALTQEPSELPVPTVLRELQRGYEMKGRVLRPCGVAVSVPSPAPQPPAGQEPEPDKTQENQ